MGNKDIPGIVNKKRFLKRYRKNMNCINRLEEKRLLLDLRMKSVKSPDLSGMPRSGQAVTMEDLVSDKLDLEKRIARLKEKGKRLKEEILEEIDSLDDSKYCEVLEAFFIDCKTIEDIADDIGYTDRHVFKLYTEGIAKLVAKDECQ